MSSFSSTYLLLVSWCLPIVAFGQTSATWKQQVKYEMDIDLHAERHQMDGKQRLTYTNNSPDTLNQVFYHLYFNAFNPTSMMAERNRHLPDPDGRIVPRIFNLGPDEVGYHRVGSLTQDGLPVSYSLNDTVLRVALAKPIPPGGRSVFEMVFNSQVPLQTRRSGRDNSEGIDYSMSQWYPKMAQYDERGWHADPYVGREFYAPFGTFDVRITLPANYIIGSTGVLQNPDEIGHGYQTDSTLTYAYDPAESLTWHFRAENVHDFAWAADPDYIHDQIEGEDGIMYHLLYLPEVASRWQPMQAWVPQLIEFFSLKFGQYPYPQFTVAQAGDGGMEYPMINFITGRRSPGSLLSVTAHEAAHEWFYGVLGSNEADYSWLDEGFTNYATTEGVAYVQGRQNPSHAGGSIGMMALDHNGLRENLNTPADWYTTNTAFGTASYSGGQMIANMLGYVISDSLRDAWFKEYFERFKFRHPNPWDVEKVAEDVSGLQLDWFFDQWTNTTRDLDYAVDALTSSRVGSSWRTEIELEREDEIVMPVDVRLTLDDGSYQWVTIPLGVMEGHKPVPEDWIVATPWNWTFPEYTLTVETQQRVVNAEIDPFARTPDVNRLNNSARFPRDLRFLKPPQQNWFRYSIGYRPLVQYAENFGIGAGAQARGTYIFGQHRIEAMLKLWPQVFFSGGEDPDLNFAPTVEPDVSFFDGIDYVFSYANDLFVLGTGATASLSARKHLGIFENMASVSKPLTGYGSPVNTKATLDLIHQFTTTDRHFEVDEFGPFFKETMLSARLGVEWRDGLNRIAVTGEFGGSLNAYFSCDDFEFVDEDGSPTLGTCIGEFRQGANRVMLEADKAAMLGPVQGMARLFVGLGNANLALQKRFRLGAATFEDAWRNDAFRTISSALTTPDLEDERRFVTFDAPGPVAYLLTHFDASPEGQGIFLGRTPTGSNIAAGSVSISGKPVASGRWLPPLRLEVFSGIGTTWSEGVFGSRTTPDQFRFEDLIADAGFGFVYDVSQLRELNRWTSQSDVLSGLNLTAKFPVWASDPELIASGEKAFAFRWLVGVTLK